MQLISKSNVGIECGRKKGKTKNEVVRYTVGKH